ncbi:MAG: SMP-30/gluconolactonase/LRE family protein [Pseudonocardiaceae bacterium]
MTLEVAVADRVMSGAGPVWDITSATVLWVEFGGEVVHRFNPATGDDDPVWLPQPLAAAHPRRFGGLVLTLRDGVALLDPDGTRRWLIYWARDGVAGAAAAVDQAGRLWVATAGDGALLRVEPDGPVSLALQGTDLSGIAFSPDAGTIYLADVSDGYIVAADFDPDTGDIGPRRPLRPAPAGPSTLCVDAEGSLWVAPSADTAVHRYRPDGSREREVPIGGAHPTGCAFGGIQLTDLYVTAAPPHGDGGPTGPLLVVPGAGEGLPTAVFAG